MTEQIENLIHKLEAAVGEADRNGLHAVAALLSHALDLLQRERTPEGTS